MFAAMDLERLRRALVPVVAVTVGLGVLAALVDSDEEPSSGGGSAVVGPGDAVDGSSPAPGADPTGGQESAFDAAGGVGPDPVPQPPSGLGQAVVPAEGTYVYEVDDGFDAGVRREERVVSVLGQEAGATMVQVVTRSEGEEQVSVLAWAADQVMVRSTRIETEDGTTRDCTWDPSFVEFGALAVDSQWTVSSTCVTDVSRLPTTFTVTGSATVIAEADVVVAGTTVRTWQLQRERTTVIRAEVGEDAVHQTVEEFGSFYIDPARGLVVRSDVNVTLSGSQQGSSRRTALLVEG